MPYADRASLPPAVRKLPGHLQDRWRGAFNGAYSGTCEADETCAFRIAWSAVKKDLSKFSPALTIEKGDLRIEYDAADVLVSEIRKALSSTESTESTESTNSDLYDNSGVVAYVKNDMVIVRAGGAKIVWAPDSSNVPDWATRDADLVFAKSTADQSAAIDPTDVADGTLFCKVDGLPRPKVPAELLAKLQTIPEPIRKSVIQRVLKGYVAQDVKYANHGMVAFYVPEDIGKQIAIPGAEPVDSLHVTLAYLGEDVSDAVTERAKEVIAEFAQQQQPLTGRMSGAGRFIGDDRGQYPIWAHPDVPGLSTFRENLVARLKSSGVEFAENHGFTPHVTLQYAGTDAPVPALPTVEGLSFDHVSLKVGDRRWDFSLGMQKAARTWAMDYAVAKASGEKQYTFGPLYIPDWLDSHGEFTTPAELEEAVWRYVRRDDRRIRLQHQPEIVAGEWVNIVSWPFTVETVMTSTDGTSRKVAFPAGTAFMGVIWLDWAWDLVKRGKLKGFSMGGLARRIEVDFGDYKQAA